jgi:flagellar basal-body rod protein FlgG
MVMAIAARGAPTMTAPTGWTLVRRDANGTTMVQAVYTHVVGASEPASYTVTLGSAQKAAGGIVGYVGVDTSGGTGVDQVSGAAGASGTSISAPSVTPTAATDTVAAFWATANGTTLTADATTSARWQSVSSGGTGGTTARVTVGAGDFTVAADGTIRSGRRTVGQLAIVSLTGATKQGDTLFSGRPGPMPAGTAVEQGYLEGSGVDPTRSMVDMIESMRAFEASQRVIHAIDDTLGRGVNMGGGT